MGCFFCWIVVSFQRGIAREIEAQNKWAQRVEMSYFFVLSADDALLRSPSSSRTRTSMRPTLALQVRGGGLGLLMCSHLPRKSVVPAPLSRRAVPIYRPNHSPYYVGLDRVREDPYDRVANPHGVIQLGLSDNKLCLDLIEDWMSKHFESSAIGGGDFAMYQPFDGMPEMKLAMAGFMSKVLGGTLSFDPSNVVLTAGATPAIEILCFCLADHGNAFLVPTPYYPGFDRDMTWRTGVEVIPVHCRSADSFTLSITALDQAFDQAMKKGLKVSGVLISNPSNPVGNLLSRDMLCNLLEFAREKNIHIISDEIFAGSVHGDAEFVSMLEILDLVEYDKGRVHVVYGLSKDLSVAGFRVGAIHSYNEDVLAASKKLTRFSSISSLTQRLLVPMLTDSGFINTFLGTNRDRSRETYKLFVEGLEQLGVNYLDSVAGSYCWVDMGGFMSSYSEKGELELWEKLLEVSKVNATPGSACHCAEPGWFRCCFTTILKDDIPVVMDRINKVAKLCKHAR
ncbi:hypothetical protein MLD38_033580 [Melastoma candidum]|uniref:Uncharacterized protein n=1 Tax=Melastoma candidum TaxID=119954 RepID=A0ACB9M7S6_9MYRT|nr:hypothetical protein MLD38_033580 [Melastoma candidum]